ncbi:hypothetical protein B0A55_02595 [Friedmanniomyces simplex]|uniref:Phytanoyl-CoA dioxygenase n=1 Tax=Friedmanniomyces simplex TaxID=329884 RepID=A0A4U0XML9_9PEZI|nr:hypothetical protein B0A55_02595 [Friedmanniomyces simplex]
MTRKTNGDVDGGDQLYNQTVHTINIPDEMCDDGKVTDEVIAKAITYLHRDGVLILKNAINPSHLDDLEAILGPEAEEIARKETRNMDQAPPLVPDLTYKVRIERSELAAPPLTLYMKDIWANPIGVGIMRAMFALKATGRQPVHSDIDKPHPLWPFAYAFNIPLCDMSVENGSTELWVGSHRESNIDQHCAFTGGETGLTIKPDLLEARRRHSPPIQASTKKGSLIIRDIRLWHAGMPNRTDSPRIMLAFVYQPRWFGAPSKVILPLKAKPLVERWEAETGVEYNAIWVDGDVDHKKINSEEVDFSTRNKALLELEEMMHLPIH